MPRQIIQFITYIEWNYALEFVIIPVVFVIHTFSLTISFLVCTLNLVLHRIPNLFDDNERFEQWMWNKNKQNW